MSDEGAAARGGSEADELRRRITLTRVVPAPPDAVFQAWTNAERMARWLCPDPTARVVVENELRLGGSWSARMETSGGTVTAFGTYREIEPPRRLAFTWEWKEPPQTIGADTVAEVEFATVDGGTEVRLCHSGFPSDETAEGHKVGWKLALERLEGIFGAS